MKCAFIRSSLLKYTGLARSSSFMILKHSSISQRRWLTFAMAGPSSSRFVHVWEGLDDLEKQILAYMAGKRQVKTSELAKHTQKAPRTISVRLNHLLELNFIKRNGTKTDPKQTYELI